MSKTINLLFTGVGGQGTILTTKLLSGALVDAGNDVKMSEIHGMAQRGGTVNTQLKYGDKVYAPNIGEGEADYVIAFEKAEALRALPFLKKGGTLVMDEREIYSMPVLLGQQSYPSMWNTEVDAKDYEIVTVPAARIAADLGSPRNANVVLLGAIAKLLGVEIKIPEKFGEAAKEAYRAGEGAVS